MAGTFVWRGKEFERLTLNESTRALTRIGIKMEGNIKESISGRGTQKIGPKGGKSRSASDPGDPPFVVTDNLRKSIGSEVSGNTLRVGTNVKYARHLEIGTKHMRPRPFLRPELDRSEGLIRREFRRVKA